MQNACICVCVHPIQPFSGLYVHNTFVKKKKKTFFGLEKTWRNGWDAKDKTFQDRTAKTYTHQSNVEVRNQGGQSEGRASDLNEFWTRQE